MSASSGLVNLTVVSADAANRFAYQDVSVDLPADIVVSFDASASFSFAESNVFHYIRFLSVNIQPGCQHTQSLFAEQMTSGYVMRCSYPQGTGTATFRLQFFANTPGSLLLSNLCMQPYANSSLPYLPVASLTAFDALVEALANYYPFFELRGVANRSAWEGLAAGYAASANGATSRADFITAVNPLLASLQDYHVYWTAANGAFLGYPWNAPYVSNIDTSWFESATGQMSNVYSSGSVFTVGQMAIGSTGRTAGYLAIHTFAFNQGIFDDLKSRLPTLLSLDALIIDVRFNTGGNDAWATSLASLFTATPVTFGLVRRRAGPGFDAWTRWIPRQTGSAALISGCLYTAPVVMLTGRACMSACDSFVAMAKALPTLTVVGDTTRGSSGNPSSQGVDGFDLALQFSRWQDVLPSGILIEGTGVAPDVPVPPPASGTLSAAQRSQWSQDTFDAGMSQLEAALSSNPGASCAAPAGSDSSSGGGVVVVIVVVVVVAAAIAALLVCRRGRGDKAVTKGVQLANTGQGMNAGV